MILAAAIVATITATAPSGESDTINLHNEQGKCPPGSNRVEYILRDRIIINGCYIVFQETVYMILDDGDRGSIPVKSFKWKLGAKPSSL